MEVYPSEEFVRRTMGGRPSRMNTSPYEGASFDCACGKSHQFTGSLVPVLRELSGMRLVLGCPNARYVTCVKVKGFIRFHGFQSLFGGGEDEYQDSSGPKDESSPADTDHLHMAAISLLIERARELDPDMSKIPEILEADRHPMECITNDFPKDEEGDFVNEALGLAVKGVPGRMGGVGAICFRASGGTWRPCGLTGELELAYQWLSGQIGDAKLDPLPSDREIYPDDVDLVHWRFVIKELESSSG